jgi:hypothetical protein
VDKAPHVGDDASLALGGGNHPHISYYDESNHDLKYTWHDGTEWHVETVDSEGRIGSDNSLALDGNGHPHISYYDQSNQDLKYAWHDGTEWHIETVDSEGDVGRGTSLTLDGAGHPHISYDDYSNYALKYAWHDGTEWHIETVDSEGDVDGDTSLALDGAGRPHISHSSFDSGDLKYAWRTPHFALTKQATPADGLRNGDKLTYTLELFGPGLNVHLWDPLPPAVRYVPGSITGPLTPTAVYSPTAHAVLWQGTLCADAAQIVRFQVTPGVTGTGSLSLARPIANTAWMTDTENGASVSATAIVNGRRTYLPLGLRTD